MSRTLQAAQLIGAIGIVAALAACSAPAAAEKEPAPSAEGSGELAGESFVVAVSADEVPFGYVDESGEFVGVTADLLDALAQKLGFEYEVEPTDFAAAIPGVQSGKYDFAFRQMGITEERVGILDLVSWKRDGVILEKAAGSDIEIGDAFEGICGLTVGILNGEAQSEAALTELSDACVADGDEPITISAFSDRATADLAVQSGRADLATNSTGMFGYSQQQKPGVFEPTGPSFNPVFQGLGFAEGSELAPVIQKALNALIADGSYARILDGYGVGDVAVSEAQIDVLAQ